jgi:hypothetical protein
LLFQKTKAGRVNPEKNKGAAFAAPVSTMITPEINRLCLTMPPPPWGDHLTISGCKDNFVSKLKYNQ